MERLDLCFACYRRDHLLGGDENACWHAWTQSEVRTCRTCKQRDASSDSTECERCQTRIREYTETEDLRVVAAEKRVRINVVTGIDGDVIGASDDIAYHHGYGLGYLGAQHFDHVLYQS